MSETIERTSSGLRDALFKALEQLRDGDMVSDDAKAFAGLAREISNTVRLEIEVAKLRNQYPSDAKLIVPSPLNLGKEHQNKIEKK
jgi:hypothetical protein